MLANIVMSCTNFEFLSDNSKRSSLFNILYINIRSPLSRPSFAISDAEILVLLSRRHDSSVRQESCEAVLNLLY